MGYFAFHAGKQMRLHLQTYIRKEWIWKSTRHGEGGKEVGMVGLVETAIDEVLGSLPVENNQVAVGVLSHEVNGPGQSLGFSKDSPFSAISR